MKKRMDTKDVTMGKGQNFLSRKKICTLCMTIFLTVNSMGTVFATNNTSVAMNSQGIQTYEKIHQNKAARSPIGKIATQSEETKSRESKMVNGLDKVNLTPELPPQSTQVEQRKKLRTSMRAVASQTYTMDSLSAMNYTDLANLLATIEITDISDLFQYNPGAYKFYSNSERVQALIDAIKQRGSQYTTEDNKGIPTLVEVLRAGFYLAFYNDQLKSMNERSYRDKCIPALLAIEKNPNFKLGTSVQDEMAKAVGLLIWNTSSNLEVITRVTPIVQQYNTNISSYITENSKGTAVYNIIGGTEYDLQNYLYEIHDTKSTHIKNSPWSGKIDPFIRELEKIALFGHVDKDNEWLINNGLFDIGTVGKFYSTPNKGNEVLTKAMQTYSYLTPQYFEAISQIADKYAGKDYNGNTVDIEQAKEAGKQKYLPKTYTFDDGKVVMHTGNAVTTEKVQRLYWASKEVRSQFYKVVGSDVALEPNNADEILTMDIYNSPAEYKMNRYLYDLDVENGGMYIEGMGTFFTYERTPEESTFTLEELFRHEFTHYLQGRYLVPGMWGSGAIYDNSRITWFEEGGAEFFAGSTRTSGVLPRKAIVNYLAADPAQRYTVDQTLHSKYGSWEFYNYGMVLQGYMYENDRELLNKMYGLVKANDVAGYDKLIATMSNDATLNSNYQKYMQGLIDNYANTTTPLVSDDYIATHEAKPASEVYADITSVAKLKNVTTTAMKSQFFNDFALKGTYTGGISQGKIQDWKNMEIAINKALQTLATYSWSGYKTLTGYFTNYRVNAANQVEFDLTFQGVLCDTAVSQNPVAKANGPYNGTKGNPINFSSQGSRAADGTSVSYLWNFGDGRTSTEANPAHLYANPGKYTVTLTVTDKLGVTNLESTIATIQDTVIGGIQNETEPNNAFNTANGPIVSGRVVPGTIDDQDTVDTFCFDVTAEGNVEVTVTNNGGIAMSWMVYEESDLQNYVAYPETSGRELTGTFTGRPGKYYLYLYSYSGGQDSYTINIKGPVGK